MQVWRIRKRNTVAVSDTDRQALVAIVTDRNSPQNHVWSAQIIKPSGAAGCLWYRYGISRKARMVRTTCVSLLMYT
jgi:hypothetical protein